MKKLVHENALYIAWLVACLGTVISLFFSEVMKLPPCVLCWYQRICMYSLVPIVGLGIVKKDPHIYRYGLLMSIIGAAIALYHNLLYYKLLPESVGPCQAGVSCTTRFIEWFGFVTIPLLSLAGFTTMAILFYLFKKTEK